MSELEYLRLNQNIVRIIRINQTQYKNKQNKNILKYLRINSIYVILL